MPGSREPQCQPGPGLFALASAGTGRERVGWSLSHDGSSLVRSAASLPTVCETGFQLLCLARGQGCRSA